MNSTTFGEVVLKQHTNGRLEVLQADSAIRISLGFIADADQRTVRVTCDAVHIAGQVTYRITGWDPTVDALIAERID